MKNLWLFSFLNDFILVFIELNLQQWRELITWFLKLIRHSLVNKFHPTVHSTTGYGFLAEFLTSEHFHVLVGRKHFDFRDRFPNPNVTERRCLFYRLIGETPSKPHLALTTSPIL